MLIDEMSFRVVDRVLQIHGGVGLTLDLPLAKGFVDQRSRVITEGASEAMRMMIARTDLSNMTLARITPNRAKRRVATVMRNANRFQWHAKN